MVKKRRSIVVVVMVMVLVGTLFSMNALASELVLPGPVVPGALSLEETIQGRRSVRSFSERALEMEEVGQLLWAAQGLTDPERGLRAAPSAGNLFPVKVYLLAGRVDGLDTALYRYIPGTHSLEVFLDEDRQEALFRASLEQNSVLAAAAVVVLALDYEALEERHGERGERVGLLEVGHAAQNLALQAVGLDLGLVTVGFFVDHLVKEALGLPANENPVYVVPIGGKQ